MSMPAPGQAPFSPNQVSQIHSMSDVDSSARAQHHTLGTGPYQAAPGNVVQDLQTSVTALQNAAAQTPVGTVIDWWGKLANVPENYVAMTGQLVAIGTHPAFEAQSGLTDNYVIPDMRGQVTLGASTDAGLATSEGSATHTHTEAAHAHTLTSAGAAFGLGATSGTDNLWMETGPSISYAASIGNSTTLAFGSYTGAQTRTTALVGSTDSTTPGATGTASNLQPSFQFYKLLKVA